jgi:hypothetical protein
MFKVLTYNGSLVPPVVVRKQLWLYKDVAANLPRARIWLDGAAAFVTGGCGRDGVLRLHPNHEEPTKMWVAGLAAGAAAVC